MSITCCDLHGRNCEPPGELCCEGCTEAAHLMGDAAKGSHADGSPCSNPDLSGDWEIGPYELAALLEMFRGDLHPAYANTSRRGRGIGGQAITSQCNYLDPEGVEYRIIDRIDAAIHEWFRRAERGGVDMQKIRRHILGINAT